MLHDIRPQEHGARGADMAAAVGTCVHCGFCLPACPTYQELEQEQDSPRGRIILMKLVLEGSLDAKQAAPHIDRCLGCLACVTHCPSGVPYGDLISSYRDEQRERGNKPWSLATLLARLTLPYPSRFRIAARLGQMTKSLKFLAPKSLRPMLDLVPDELPPKQQLAELTPAVGKRRGRVALQAGCAQQVLAPDINASALRVLSRNGIEVVIPKDQGCCGALSWHTGQGNEAAQFARRLIASIPDDIDYFVTTAAGCGSAIHEYALLLRGTDMEDAAKKLAEKTLDISVYLDQLQLERSRRSPVPVRVAYHDACHLAHAQGVRAAPRRLLERIPGLATDNFGRRRHLLRFSRTYNIEQPEIAAQTGRSKGPSSAR